ncbi:phage protein [Klebsiella pneumoniae]|nr:phage protein [Klebsiella pneumoniae]
MAMYESAPSGCSVASTVTVGNKMVTVALGILPGSILVSTAAVVLTCMRSNPWTATRTDADRNSHRIFRASYGIITAETASTSSFANQLASAFCILA